MIAAIHAALAHGDSRPWMYDVLALTMRIAGRPQSEIERVLLSRIDFTAADVPSMLYSAAYLTRFGAEEQALKLYRQVSELAPARPEPYVLGLKLARRLKDYEALRWAVTGILTTAWTEDHERLHRRAENAALEAQQQLRQAGRDREADRLQQAVRRALQRDLVLRLTWSGGGDLDLLVEEPTGTTCSVATPQTRGGGVLVHDGYGPDQENCYENYVCPLGGSGIYKVRIRHVWGRIVGKRARLTVIRYKGTEKESRRTFPIPLGGEDRLVRLTLAEGRRRRLAAVPEREPVRRDRRHRSLRHKVGRLGPGARQAGRDFGESRRRLGQLQFPGGGAGLGGGGFGTVGLQPVVTVIPEGVSMGALAVVSGDRRYVRLSTAPFFTAISNVATFSFFQAGGGGVGGGGGGGNQGGGGGP